MMSSSKIVSQVSEMRILAAGAIRVRIDRVLRMADHDEYLGRRHYQLMPGDALDGQPQEVVTFAAAHWAPELLRYATN
ncbi:hypothetical protein D3874_06010 [Oleomonas cavernae]|uniref:Uncharacterized protein n=2 Tax=Oleomonas cavernae TaxID=2320859 RepID=A0A418W9C3_9PROT|nr:hypothetical protein D3874_06010 [Oleomonas cavernae]